MFKKAINEQFNEYLMSQDQAHQSAPAMDKAMEYGKRLKKQFKNKLNSVIMLNLTMILNLKALKGLVYIKALCEKIRLAKVVFLASFEEDFETFIP